MDPSKDTTQKKKQIIMIKTTMVERKTSVYDSDSTPFAEAMPAGGGCSDYNHGDFMMVDATASNDDDDEAVSQTQPLMATAPVGAPIHTGTTPVAAAATPSAPPEAEAEPIPNIPTAEEEHEERQQNRKIGAGVASGTFGFLLGGPFLGLLFGFGAAYATEQSGAAGDISRSIGDLALTAKDKAIEIDNKHNVVEKTKIACGSVWTKAQEMDRQHRIVDKTKNFVVTVWMRTVDFVKRHRLIERGVEGIGKVVTWCATAITEQIEQSRVNNDNNPSSQSIPNQEQQRGSSSKARR